MGPIEFVAYVVSTMIGRLPFVSATLEMRRKSRAEVRPCEAHRLRVLEYRFHLMAI